MESSGRDLRAQMAEFEMTVHTVLEQRNSGLEPQNTDRRNSGFEQRQNSGLQPQNMNRRNSGYEHRNSGFEQRRNSGLEYRNNVLEGRNSGLQPQNLDRQNNSGFERQMEYRHNVMEHQNSGLEPQNVLDGRNSGIERRNNVQERQNSNFEDFWIRDIVGISSPASTIAPSPQARNSPSPIPIVQPFIQVVKAENVNKSWKFVKVMFSSTKFTKKIKN